HDRRELQSDAELLLFERDRGTTDAAVVSSDRYEDLAAGEEARFLTADRDDIGLGQHLDQAVAAVGVDGERVSRTRGSAEQAGRIRQQVADDRVTPAAADARRVDPHAELVGQVLRYLGNRDLEHHLLRLRNAKHVDDLGLLRPLRATAATRHRRLSDR